MFEKKIAPSLLADRQCAILFYLVHVRLTVIEQPGRYSAHSNLYETCKSLSFILNHIKCFRSYIAIIRKSKPVTIKPIRTVIDPSHPNA